ncbi:MAG: hypothetical protein R2818_13885 [Flavobacteriales bacterium]
MRTFGTLLLSLATTALFAQGPETIPFPDHLKSFAQAAKEELSPEVVNGNKDRPQYARIRDMAGVLKEQAHPKGDPQQVAAMEMGLTYAVAAHFEGSDPELAGYLAAMAAWRYVSAVSAGEVELPLSRLDNVEYYARKASEARTEEQLARMHERLVRQVDEMALALTGTQ